MKNAGDLPTMAVTTGNGHNVLIASNTSTSGCCGGYVALFSKGRYKFWALSAILLLALWSMFTGTVTLKWSAGNLSRLSADGLDAPRHGGDLDVLEMEERGKMVRHMWEVYAHGQRIRLPRFWQQAFEAAYEDLAGEDTTARDAAVAEIARMSMRMVDLDPPPPNPKKDELEKKEMVADNKLRVKSSSLSSGKAQ